MCSAAPHETPCRPWWHQGIAKYPIPIAYHGNCHGTTVASVQIRWRRSSRSNTRGSSLRVTHRAQCHGASRQLPGHTACMPTRRHAGQVSDGRHASLLRPCMQRMDQGPAAVLTDMHAATARPLRGILSKTMARARRLRRPPRTPRFFPARPTSRLWKLQWKKKATCSSGLPLWAAARGWKGRSKGKSTNSRASVKTRSSLPR